MSADALTRPWVVWTATLAADLRALTPRSWVTATVRPAHAPAEHRQVADVTPHGWRRLLGRPSPEHASVPDVFVQARVIEGRLVLECIGDTEFEGLSDLTTSQQERLVALGWERYGIDPSFSRVWPLADSDEAAELLTLSLREVLGASEPDDVEVRHQSV